MVNYSFLSYYRDKEGIAMSKEDAEVIFHGEQWVDFSKKYKPILNNVIKKANEHISFMEQFKGKEILEFIERYTDRPLFQYLDSLNDKDVKVIKTIMYIGRDKDYNQYGTPYSIFKQKYNELEFVNNEKLIDVELIIEKNPLIRYIHDGMNVLKMN